MTRFEMACFAGALAGALAAPLAATAGPTEDAQVRALEARFARAVAHKDLAAIMEVYSPKVFVFDVVPPRQYVGAAAYREDWKGFLSGFSGPVKFDIADLDVTTDGDVGYGHSIQHIVGAAPNGTATDMTVRVTDVYRRTGGAWRIVQEHVSVPVDLASGKPDMTSKP